MKWHGTLFSIPDLRHGNIVCGRLLTHLSSVMLLGSLFSIKNQEPTFPMTENFWGVLSIVPLPRIHI